MALCPSTCTSLNGVAYRFVTSSEQPNKDGPPQHNVDIDVACKGKVELIADMTGEINATETGAGLSLKNLDASRIPGPIGNRSDTPFKMPVY